MAQLPLEQESIYLYRWFGIADWELCSGCALQIAPIDFYPPANLHGGSSSFGSLLEYLVYYELNGPPANRVLKITPRSYTQWYVV